MSTGIERIWYGSGPAAIAGRILLAPASWVFGLIALARAGMYARGLLRSEPADAPVVSVGNLNVGGTGKTPMVVWLVERLLNAGFRPVVVCRGYGGKAGRPVVVDFDYSWSLPQDLSHRVFRPRSYSEGLEAAGDEAVLVARRTGCPVVAFADRAEACRTACDAYEPDCLILDDGFQHLRLRRGLDIVLLGERDQGARLLPAGPLRERMSALARADIVIRTAPDAPLPRVRRSLTGLVARPDADARIAPLASLAGKRIAVLAAIANPDGFFAMVAETGAEIVVKRTFADHHPYDDDDWDDVLHEARAAGAEMIVTTEKDLVKLERVAGRTDLLRAVRLSLDVEGGDEIIARITSLDARHGPTHDRAAAPAPAPEAESENKDQGAAT